MLKWVTGILGDSNEKEVRRLARIVEQVNALEPEMQALSDAQLRAQTDQFRHRAPPGGGAARPPPPPPRRAPLTCVPPPGAPPPPHEVKIAEMKTGEGKTLVATLALY